MYPNIAWLIKTHVSFLFSSLLIALTLHYFTALMYLASAHVVIHLEVILKAAGEAMQVTIFKKPGRSSQC